jgi:hypothetical protein
MILDNRPVSVEYLTHHLRISIGSAHGVTQHRFVQDGFQNNSQESTSATVWQSAKAYCTPTVIKVTLSGTHCHWRKEVDPPLRSRKKTPEWKWNIRNSQSKTSSKFNYRRRKWCWQSFERTETNSGTLSREGTTVSSVHHSKMLWGHLETAILTKNWGLLSKGGAIYTIIPDRWKPLPRIETF